MGEFSKELVLKPSKKYKFLLCGYFGGCDNCNTEYHLERYSLEGKLLAYIDIDVSYDFEVDVDTFPNYLMFTSYTRTLKEEYKDSTDHIFELEEEYGDVNKYYDYGSSITKISLTPNDDVTFEQYPVEDKD